MNRTLPIIVPSQHFGIGDVIFTVSLVRQYIASGHKVVWPVLAEYRDGLNHAYPDIEFVSFPHFPGQWFNEKKEVVLPGGRHKTLPLRWADQMLGRPYTECMQSKYALYGQDWRIWKDNGMFKRTARERRLMHMILKEHGVGKDDEFILVNDRFKSDNSGNARIKPDNPHNLKIVRMRPNTGYSLFDWALLLEWAAEVHTVSTSVLYLLELMPEMERDLHLYPRRPEETDFRNVEQIFTKPYILHK